MSDSPLRKSPDVVQMDLTNLDFKDYIISARISNEALFGIVSPAWDAAPRGKKEEALKKMILAGKDKGYNKVHLFNNQGQLLASGGENKVEIK
jgi:hypothetical protein